MKSFNRVDLEQKVELKKMRREHITPIAILNLRIQC